MESFQIIILLIFAAVLIYLSYLLTKENKRSTDAIKSLIYNSIYTALEMYKDIDNKDALIDDVTEFVYYEIQNLKDISEVDKKFWTLDKIRGMVVTIVNLTEKNNKIAR